MTQERKCPCFPAASFSQQGAPERGWEAEVSPPLMQQPFHAALTEFSVQRGCFPRDLLSSFSGRSEVPLREWVGRCPKGPQARSLPGSRGRKSPESS